METQSGQPGDDTAPVIIFSYQFSGARFIQQAVADGTDLACTVSTGILPQCAAAVRAWSRIDQRPANSISQLAVSSIRALVRVQLTSILAYSGGQRWCELATSEPDAAQAFLQIFPQTRLVCVHRACAGFVSAAVAARPWEMAHTPMIRFALRYHDNAFAAAAAYWVWATEGLLMFEASNPECTSRVRYEDAIADRDVLGGIRDIMHISQRYDQLELSRPALEEQRHEHISASDSMIPDELRERIDHLEGRLGYPPALP